MTRKLGLLLIAGEHVGQMIRKLKRIRQLLSQLGRIDSRLSELQEQIDYGKILTAYLLIEQMKSKGIVDNLREVEFKVFSQFGDDGIIQYLVNQVRNLAPTFVEFGVQTYYESNTRFLLLNNNWSGLIMDSDGAAIDYIKRDPISWRHDLTAIRAFIDKDNINELLSTNGFTGEIGILSIDIDGNDYWVWERINVIKPAIVIIEYNSAFGPGLAVTVPYDSQFTRFGAHYSGLFWGASLRALELLGKKKGYALVGCNSAGNNAYFIQQERIGDLPVVDTHRAFVDAKFRDSRGPAGEFTFISGARRFAEIAHLDVIDVERDIKTELKSLV